MSCTNCGAVKHSDKDYNACVLVALCGVLQTRGYTREEVRAVMSSVDPDELWELVGPAVDWLEEQIPDEEALLRLRKGT